MACPWRYLPTTVSMGVMSADEGYSTSCAWSLPLMPTGRRRRLSRGITNAEGSPPDRWLGSVSGPRNLKDRIHSGYLLADEAWLENAEEPFHGPHDASFLTGPQGAGRRNGIAQVDSRVRNASERNMSHAARAKQAGRSRVR